MKKNKTCSTYEIQEENVHYSSDKLKKEIELEFLKELEKAFPIPYCSNALNCPSIASCKKRNKCTRDEQRQTHIGEYLFYQKQKEFIERIKRSYTCKK